MGNLFKSTTDKLASGVAQIRNTAQSGVDSTLTQIGRSPKDTLQSAWSGINQFANQGVYGDLGWAMGDPTLWATAKWGNKIAPSNNDLAAIDSAKNDAAATEASANAATSANQEAYNKSVTDAQTADAAKRARLLVNGRSGSIKTSGLGLPDGGMQFAQKQLLGG